MIMSSFHRWWSWLSWWINFLTNFFKNITRRFHGKTQKNTEELLYIFPLAAFCTFLSWCQHFLSWFVSQNNHNKVHCICGYKYTRYYKGIYILIIYHYISLSLYKRPNFYQLTYKNVPALTKPGMQLANFML